MESVLFQPMKNKIFRMHITGDQITVEFGHIGNKLYKKSYPASAWNEIYQESGTIVARAVYIIYRFYIRAEF